MSRHLVWFSCGAASAVAAKLSIDLWGDDVQVVNCDTLASEHPDNGRFLSEVEDWLGVRVERIRSEKFEDVDDVFETTRYMAGIHGARCTVEMKKVPRFGFQRVDDVHIFGFRADEVGRIEKFEDNNPLLRTAWPLVDAGYVQDDCFRVLTEAGIRLPVMYELGYKNNNCLGCVKATSARYWNMTRRDFPDVFERRSRQSRDLGVRLTRYKGVRVFLDELPEDYLPAEPLEDISCGPDCRPSEHVSTITEVA